MKLSVAQAAVIEKIRGGFYMTHEWGMYQLTAPEKVKRQKRTTTVNRATATALITLGLVHEDAIRGFELTELGKTMKL